MQTLISKNNVCIYIYNIGISYPKEQGQIKVKKISREMSNLSEYNFTKRNKNDPQSTDKKNRVHNIKNKQAKEKQTGNRKSNGRRRCNKMEFKSSPISSTLNDTLNDRIFYSEPGEPVYEV